MGGDDDADASFDRRCQLAQERYLHFRVQVGFRFLDDERISRPDDVPQVERNGGQFGDHGGCVHQGQVALPAFRAIDKRRVVNLGTLYANFPAQQSLFQAGRQVFAALAPLERRIAGQGNQLFHEVAKHPG